MANIRKKRTSNDNTIAEKGRRTLSYIKFNVAQHNIKARESDRAREREREREGEGGGGERERERERERGRE